MTEAMTEPAPQLNRALGENTVQFHLDGTMPNPRVVAIERVGGTPNQKAERWANRIAFYHFVEPDADRAERSLQGAVELFQGQLVTGHQCIGATDEALTLSHAPIWWRAILSLRLTSHRLAKERGGRYGLLERLVLDWLEFHTSLNRLGEIASGPRRAEVWLPGARTRETGDPSTDRVNNVIHQIITRGRVVSRTGRSFFVLTQKAQDRAGAALARQIQRTIGFGIAGSATDGRLPKLRNRLVVERFDDGHVARYPDGVERSNGHALEAWAQYPSGRIGHSKRLGRIPPDVRFQGRPRTFEVREAV